jgi:small redox-active disulfide protein 2
MILEILGSGCAKCQTLEEKVRKVANRVEPEAEVRKVTDINKIMEYGIMTTPALVLDGKVLFSGRSADEKELESLISGK